MFKFKHLKDNSDATSNYDIILDKPYTVKELVQEVLTRDEWGYIHIKLTDSWFGGPRLEYYHDTVVDGSLRGYLYKTIDRIFANGGWSSMDYWITLKGEENNEKMETN